MKILIVSKKIPYPPHTGGNVRIFNLIKRISQHCEVSLICMSDRKLIKNAFDHCQYVELCPYNQHRI